MQFYSPIQNYQPQQPNYQNKYTAAPDLNAYLNDQALKFAQKQLYNAQNHNSRLKLGDQPRIRTCQDLRIRPLYSDDDSTPLIEQFQQYENKKVIQKPLEVAIDTDLDAFLTRQAEEFARANMKTRSEDSVLHYGVQQVQHNVPYIHNQLGAQAQPNQFIQQPVQYIIQQPQPQPQQIQQVRQARQVQRVQQAQPQEYVRAAQPQEYVRAAQPQEYVRAAQPQKYVHAAQPRLNELVLAAPTIRQEANRGQTPSTNAEAKLQQKMEFMKKGPKGESLYKVVEGGVNFYVKRGLSPEAVCNYNLAHIIGVGPPIEILGSDGIKMEEGVCMRQAIKDKLITVDEAFKQVRGLHKTLYDAGMAHCDVKFENCLYFPRYKKVLLIDNGDLALYGNKRTIKTAGANSTMIIAPTGFEERNRVGPATDLRGFMHIMMNTLDEEDQSNHPVEMDYYH